MFLALSLDLVLMSRVLKSLPSAVILLSIRKEGSPRLFLIIFRAKSMLLLILLPVFIFDESILLFLESFCRYLFLELLSVCFCTSRTDILLVLIGWNPLKDSRLLFRMGSGSLPFLLALLSFKGLGGCSCSVTFLGE